MNTMPAIPLSVIDSSMVRSSVNQQLSLAGLSISFESAEMLARRRAESLANAERIEFGIPAISVIAEAVATSPHITQDNVADTLAELQDAFYILRDELPVDIPDAEIAEALRGWLDEWGNAADAIDAPVEEIMAFSPAYAQAKAEQVDRYRITDDEGRAYAFCSSEWDYDEQADGWDGERWADDWDD